MSSHFLGHSPPAVEEATADTLNWSVSGISVVSNEVVHALQSETSSRSSSRASSSHFHSPRRSRSHREIREMDNLLIAMQSLVASEERPGVGGLSFQRLAAEETDSIFEEEEEGEEKKEQRPMSRNDTESRAAGISVGSLNTTPPVRDPGPDPSRQQTLPPQPTSSSSKLDQMRSRLRDLESVQKKYATSKIPRRSLNFIGSSNRSASLSSAVDSESRPPSSDSLSTDCVQNTVIENRRRSSERDEAGVARNDDDRNDNLTVVGIDLEKLRDMERQFQAEAAERQALDSALKLVRHQLLDSEKRLADCQDSEGKKDMALREMKVQMGQLVHRWSSEQESRLEEMKLCKVEASRLRKEMAEVKQQAFMCEEELEKALRLADEFRRKAEEEEKVQVNLAQHLENERQSYSKKIKELQDQLLKNSGEKSSLQQELKFMQSKMSLSEKSANDMKRAKEEYEVIMANERGKMQKQLNVLQEKQNYVEKQLIAEQTVQKNKESELHLFYQSQMESILSEKVQQLQSHVSECESNFMKEKEVAVKGIQQAHKKDCEELKEKYLSEIRSLLCNFADQKESLEVCLRAARQEADCLREQLRQSQKLLGQGGWWHQNNVQGLVKETASNADLDLFGARTTATDSRAHSPWGSGSSSSTVSFAAASSRLFQSKVQNSEPVSLPSPALLNNRRLHSRAPPRPDSADPLRGSYDDEARSSQKRRKSKKAGGGGGGSDEAFSNVSHSSNCALLTTEEKEEVVRQYVIQFLDENPGVAMDPALMSSLKSMASKLVQQSFRLDSSTEQRNHGSFRSVENDLTGDRGGSR